MNLTESTDQEYLYIIHGVIPEVMPPVAYRCAGRTELAGRKVIKCPYCPGVLTDVDRDTLVQLFRKPRSKPMKRIPGLKFLICEQCKGEVGFIMK
ncbi:MAG: hypothetical protein FWC62_02710 [Firmicutes bacterium]|nr:hypothetical protein [Bacillota bacterium]